MGTMSRSKVVSPNRFGDSKLWKTPDEDPEFWEPCKHDQGYITLSPGEDDCCRMCSNTDADELVPCAWCNSWAHYRCTYAVGPGRACASHFKVLNPLDKIVVARDDDPVVPTAQQGRQVFPNCCHPRVPDNKKPTPSNVHYATEAYWVFKHAWRGVGAYYQKGDHIQKKKTGNAPVEFKALRMFPDWERWITPRPTFLSDQLLKEAATLEEKGETKNRVKRHNVFDHYPEGFQPLPNPPMAIQSFKEYKGRSNLDPNTGNLWGCFWDACSVKEKGSGRKLLDTTRCTPRLMTARCIVRLILVRITLAIDPRVMRCQLTGPKIMISGSVTTLMSRRGKLVKSPRRELFEWHLIRFASGLTLCRIPVPILMQIFHPLRWKQIKQLLLQNHLEKGRGRDNLLYLLGQIQPKPSKRGQWLKKRTKRLVKGREGYPPFPSKHWQLLQRHWHPGSMICIPV